MPSKKMKLIILLLSCFMASSAYGFIYVISLLTFKLGGNASHVGILLSNAGLATLMLVGFSASLAKRFSPSLICGLGMLLCLIGFYTLQSVHQIGWLYYSVGWFLGGGWSLYYATSPMILNHLSEDKERGKHLSLMAAFVVLGTAVGPLISQSFVSHHLDLENLYLIPIFLSITAAALFFTQGYLWNEPSALSEIKTAPTKREKWSSIFLKIWQSEARYPLLMVFLGACILSSMLNFQIGYADNHQLNYSVYYFCYMLSVVLSRFLFGGILTKKNPIAATPALLFLMILGLAILILNKHNPLLYGLAAFALGISYGLVYPLIKTYAINVTAKEYRHEVLAYFTLFYFAGVYGFPLLAGYLIKTYGYTPLLGVLILIVSLDLIIGWQRSRKII